MSFTDREKLAKAGDLKLEEEGQEVPKQNLYKITLQKFRYSYLTAQSFIKPQTGAKLLGNWFSGLYL